MIERGVGMELTHFSLFSGIGGADIAAEWAGFKSIGQVEWADYPTKVLEKHWPDVPRWRDIRDVRADNIRPIIGDGITVLSGGFPCQPFSVAGRRKGKDDDRFLWPEMLRVIQELQPTWVIGENVANLTSMAEFETVCNDLEGEDYEVQPLVFPAASVGAWHKRYRVFVVAHTRCKQPRGEVSGMYEEKTSSNYTGRDKVVPNTNSPRLKEFNFAGIADKPAYDTRQILERWDCWPSEPGIHRVANGISNRAHRLKCLGNAIVPQQIYPIFKAIADIERMVSR